MAEQDNPNVAAALDIMNNPQNAKYELYNRGEKTRLIM